MKRLVFLLVITMSAAMSFGQVSREFSGKLDSKLSADMFHLYQRVYSAVGTKTAFKLEAPPPEGSTISTGELIDQRGGSKKTIMLIVEPPGATPFLWVDGNGNGVYEKAEQTTMESVTGTTDFATVLWLPIANIRYKGFPIYVRFFPGFRHPGLKPTDRLIEQSAYALAFGHVLIENRDVLFQYSFSPADMAISVLDGTFGVDVDGDGRVRSEQFSAESQYTSKDEAVFPLRNIYVSTHMIDLATGNIVVRQREKAEYTRADLELGGEMPDFTFMDLAGRERKLSDFRGKYVMVDFWGVWCGDCTRETPVKLAAYERFRKRGFEILGIDSEDKIATLRDYLAKNKITWTQATADSTKALREETYRLQEYPSSILLAPDGKVLVLNQQQLQGTSLLQTLERILPK